MHITPARAALAALAIVAPTAASAADPPYLQLARFFGTPHLVDAVGPRDKSQLLLHFVRDGETAGAWTKMTTVSILHVAPGDTDAAVRTVIVRLRARLQKTHARIATFDQHLAPPVSAYFDVTASGERDAGIAYSPSAGFVTVAQVGARSGARVEGRDVAQLRHIIGK